MTSVDPIPTSIVKAICAIQTTLGAVAKTNRNTHGGYNYASADDVYAALARKMGEVGLILICLEDSCEIKRFEGKDGKPVQWAHMEFSFVLATEEATWTDKRSRRTLYIQVTGPQTFQAAQSYVEKAYLRSLFKIPTGDMDLDSMPQADNEDDQVALATQPRKRKSSAAAKRDGDDVVFNEMRGAIEACESVADLLSVRTKNIAVFTGAPARWAQILEDEYEDKLNDLRRLEAAE